MAKPISKTYTAASSVPGPQQAVALEYEDFSTATIAVGIVSGLATYHVEFTLDDVNDPTVTPFWFTMEEFPVGSSQSLYTAIYYPFAFIRLNLEALTGTVVFKLGSANTPIA